MTRKVNVSELEVGMYVETLDRPWLSTDFLFQGFEIVDEKELARLRAQCEFVYISSDDDPLAPKPMIPSSNKTEDKPFFTHLSQHNQEIGRAKNLYESTQDTVAYVLDDIYNTDNIDTKVLEKTSRNLVESVVRNPDALMWLAKLKNKDNYLYSHAVDSCVYLLAFGRHLGFDKDELCELGMIGILQDCGKTKLPEELLNKTEKLTPEELELMRTHVQLSLEVLDKSGQVPPRVRGLCPYTAVN